MREESRVVSSLRNGQTAQHVVVSVNMLFADKSRWDKFSNERFAEIDKEVAESNLTVEVVIVFNYTPSDRIFLELVQEIINRRSYPVRVFFHTPNNIPMARNLAAAHSTGKFLWIADDDVRVSHGTLRYLANQMPKYPVGVLSVTCFDREKNLLKPSSDMPLVDDPRHPELKLAAGVHGMAFLAYRSIYRRMPLSETRVLRGEWVEWFTRLWRAGIPVGYLSDGRYYLIDEYFIGEDGKGRSATRTDSRLIHVLISMINLLYEYEIKLGTFSSDILREKYLRPNLDLNGSPMDVGRFWTRLTNQTRRIRSDDSPKKLAGRLAQRVTRRLKNVPEHVNFSLRSAFRHMIENAGQMRKFKREQVTNGHHYEVGPFGLFDPNEETRLDECIKLADERLKQFRH